MELDKYRAYSDRHQDDGACRTHTVGESFDPDFLNRNTIQIWNISTAIAPVINKWKGTTLTERTLHEITIVNNSNITREITFTGNYSFPDKETIETLHFSIGANGSAHFYCTAVSVDKNLIFTMRKGSQDDRKLG